MLTGAPTGISINTQFLPPCLPGYIMGISGRAGLDIDACGFYFLRSVVTARLVDVKWFITPDQLGWYEDTVSEFPSTTCHG